MVDQDTLTLPLQATAGRRRHAPPGRSSNPARSGTAADMLAGTALPANDPVVADGLSVRGALESRRGTRTDLDRLTEVSGDTIRRILAGQDSERFLAAIRQPGGE